MSAHALIAPSGLVMTVVCPGSVRLQAASPPQPETEEILEGIAADHIAMMYAAGRGREFPTGTVFISRGREWEVDADMVEGALMFMEACGGPHSTLRLQDPVRISRIDLVHCWGTPDAWRYDPEYRLDTGETVKLIRVVDYKYGHRFVEVFENYQLAAYAAGVMERLNLTDNEIDLWVDLTIVQPRTYHREGPVRTWRCHASDLRATLNVARGAAEEALGPNPRTVTNENCIDCTARAQCKTLQHATGALVDFSGSAEIVELPPQAIGQELAMVEDAIDRLTARQTGLAAQAEVFLRQGKPVAFYHMDAGESRRTYFDNVAPDELISLGDLFGINLRQPPKLKNFVVTPTQAIRLGIDAGVIEKYSHRPPAALKLTRDNSITARKVFTK